MYTVRVYQTKALNVDDRMNVVDDGQDVRLTRMPKSWPFENKDPSFVLFVYTIENISITNSFEIKHVYFNVKNHCYIYVLQQIKKRTKCYV